MDLHNLNGGIFFYMKVLLCENMKNPLSLAMVIKRGVFTIFTKFVWLIWLTKISEINNLYIQSKTLIKLKKEALLFTCTLKSHRYLRSIIIQFFLAYHLSRILKILPLSPFINPTLSFPSQIHRSYELRFSLTSMVNLHQVDRATLLSLSGSGLTKSAP